VGHDCTLKKQPPRANLPLLLAHFFGLTLSLEGITHRVERLADNLGRDRAWMLEVQQAVELYSAAGGTLPLAADPEPRIREARWMLEELRLSLFAQPLGAHGPISVQRIRKQLAG
jgi:ATP-dependent helicase HrpA